MFPSVNQLMPIVIGTVLGAIVFNNLPRVVALLPAPVSTPLLGVIGGK